MLENILGKLGLNYVDVDKTSYDKVLGLFKDGIVFEPSTGIEFLYVASYFKYVKIDDELAIVNYRKSVDLGETKAMYCLGTLLFDRKEYNDAEIYYKKGAELGDTYAMTKLAYLYTNIKEDHIQAESYYKKASDMGYHPAMNNLACFYYDIKKDYTQAEVYYKKAANLGNLSAIGNLARFYEHAKKDYDQAEFYFKKGAKLGNKRSIYDLGVFYKRRRENYVLAEFYLQQLLQPSQTTKLNITHDAINQLFEIYNTTSKFEEAFLLAHQYRDLVGSESMIGSLGKLKHPISKQNQEKIYPILETLKLPPNTNSNEHLFFISLRARYGLLEI